MPTPIDTSVRTNITPDSYDFGGVTYKKESRLDGQGNSYTVDVPQPAKAPSPVATTEKTAGQIYDFGAEDPLLSTAIKNRTQSAYDTGNETIDEEQIRADKLAEYQAEIDATNSVYADKLRVAKVAGRGRLGSSTAIQGRRGLLGSDFGAAQTDTVEQGNTDIENTIENERALKVSQLMSEARTNADTEVAAKRAAKEAGLDDYIKYLGEDKTRKEANTNKVIAALIAQGIDPAGMDKTALETVAKGYGIKGSDILSGYQLQAYSSKKAKDDAEAKRKQDLEDELVKKGITSIGEGNSGYKYNPVTKQYELVAHVNKQFAPTGGTGVGLTGPGGTYVPGVNPVVDAWAAQIWDGTKKITDIPAKESALRNAVVVALQANGNTLSGRPTVTELGKAARNTAQDLLNKFDLGKGTSAVGKSALLGSFGAALLPGTERADFVNTLESLKSQLALEGVKYLKGQGAVSDAERALLQKAVTKLNPNQSETEFRKTLEDIIARLDGEAVATPSVTQQVEYPIGSGKIYNVDDKGEMTPVE